MLYFAHITWSYMAWSTSPPGLALPSCPQSLVLLLPWAPRSRPRSPQPGDRLDPTVENFPNWLMAQPSIPKRELESSIPYLTCRWKKTPLWREIDSIKKHHGLNWLVHHGTARQVFHPVPKSHGRCRWNLRAEARALLLCSNCATASFLVRATL